MEPVPEVQAWETPRYVAHHVVRTFENEACTGKAAETLFFGDDILGATEEGGKTRLLLTGGRTRWIKGSLETTERPPLALLFLDVGQGDACHITTPDGKRLLIDGGENKLAARYLAKRYLHETAASGQVVFDAVVITHGDADHFEGLSVLVLDAAEEEREAKHIRFATRRVYHNGLAKRPDTRDGKSWPETEKLGPVAQHLDGTWVATGLIDDIRTLPDDELNKHFKRWKTALEALGSRHELGVKRIDHMSRDAFNFIADVGIEVLGPRPIALEDGRAGLPLLPRRSGSPTAAQTINGHSITLKLTYRRARILLTGDLTKESADGLLALHNEGAINLTAEVLKVPHHGSNDYSIPFLVAVNPAVSIISAGDENAMRDHMHPRANVLGALGTAGRGDEPLIFVTNLSAFDAYSGPAFRAKEIEQSRLRGEAATERLPRSLLRGAPGSPLRMIA